MAVNLVMFSDQDAEGSRVVEERLLALLSGRGKRVGYVPAELDQRRGWFGITQRHYARLGLALEESFVDWAMDPRQLEKLWQCDAIHLSGGNTFRFLHWLRAFGLLELLRAYARDGVLVGVSAGSILMTPDIGSAALCEDEREEGPQNDAGLGLVDFCVRPHFDGSAAAIEEWLRYSSTVAGPVYGIPDGSGIVVADGAIELVGSVSVARNGARVT